MTDMVPREPAGGVTPSQPQARYSPQDGYYPESEDTIHLKDVIAILRRQIWLVLAFVLAGAGVAAWIVWRQQPEYRASALIRLKNEREALAGSFGDKNLDQMMGRTADPLLSQLEQLRSRTLAAAIVDRLGLRLRSVGGEFSPRYLESVAIQDDVRGDTLQLRFTAHNYRVMAGGKTATAAYGQPVSIGGVALTIRERPRVDEAQLQVLGMQEAIANVQRNLRATPREKTDVVEVNFTSNDPARSQAVVNAAIDAFQQANADNAQDQSRRRRIFLEQQLAKTDSILMVNQDALSDFREREQVFSSRDRFASEQTALGDLQIKREELLADRRVYVSLLDAITRSTQENSRGLRALAAAPGLGNNPVISQMYTQLVRYELTRDSLTTGRYASAQTNPDVQRLNTLIANTQRNLVDAVRSYLVTLDARLRSMEETLSRNTAQIERLPAKEAEEMRLVQQVETARLLADQLRTEYQKAQIAEAVEVGQVEIIDRATFPGAPINSGRSLKLALGLLMGLSLGAGAAFLREHLNTQISRREEIEPHLGVPALAVIPRLVVVKKPTNRLALRRPLSNGNGNGKAALSRPLEELAIMSAGRSSAAEAYRSLRTNLLFSQEMSGIKSLLVTSPLAGEGKTTTAANLAVAFAQQGMRVILVDCDLRKPRLHKVFNVAREPGLSDLIAGRAVAADVLRTSGVAGLSIITAGTSVPNPAELLGSKRMKKLVSDFEGHADLTIFDAPPVLVAGDASIISALAKATVLVLRAAQTDRGAARASMDQLATVGANVLGAVLNDPDGKVRTGEGYNYYAYSYYGEDA